MTVTQPKGRPVEDIAPKPYVIPPRPEILSLTVKEIPAAIRAVSAWVGWKWELNPERQQWTKIPVNLSTGNGKYHASSTDPDTWVAFQTAVKRYRQWGCDGIGCCVTDDWVFVDLDGVLDADGHLRDDCPWAQNIMRALSGRAYVEVSPSGTGLHLITRGELPPGGRKKSFSALGGKVGYELYDSGKYFAFTGHAHAGSAAPLPSSKRLARLHTQLFPPAREGTNGKTDMSGFSEMGIEDGQLLEKARTAKNGAKFSRLFDQGDTSGYPSQSEADLALCSLLAFWTQGDAGRVDCLFRQSRLYREKWDRDGYRDGVIQKAMTGKTEFYNPPRLDATATVRQPDLLSQHFSDYGNSRRLIALHGEEMRYCYGFKKWLVWDGRRWAIDDGERSRQMAQDTVLEFARQTLAASNDAATKFAGASMGTQRISNMLREAQPDLAIRSGDLDTHSDLLNFTNGTLDLRTGVLEPHRREDYITKLIHYECRSEAACPVFMKFLEQVTNKNPALITYLQRAFGYSLTGTTIEKAVFLLYGQGDNGKSTLLTLFLRLLEEYAVLLQIDTLMARQESNNTQADLADLRGARFVMTSETEEGQRLATGKLKRITQGMGKIKATRKYENPIEFPETHKLWIDANHLPIIRETDNAIWNRLHPIPFRVRFPKERQDPDLPTKLLTEAEGVLAWAVSGAVGWFLNAENRKGLGKPPEVEKAAKDWRADSDQVGRFIDERCTRDADCNVRASDLYAGYKQWCEDNGEKFTMTGTAFGRRMVEQPGVSRVQTTKYRMYRGIGLK